MDNHEELMLRRALKRATDAGDLQAELKVRREWQAAGLRNQKPVMPEPVAGSDALGVVAANVGAGLHTAREGLQQLGADPTGIPKDVRMRTLGAGGFFGLSSDEQAGAEQRQAEFNATPGAQGDLAALSRETGEYAPYGLTGAPRAAQAGAQGLIAGAANFVDGNESRAGNAAGGLAGGLVGGKVGDWIDDVGRLLTDRLARKIKGEFEPDTKEVIELGDKHGVPVYGMDVTDSKALGHLSTWMDKIPLIGTMTPRLAQRQKQRQAAVEALNSMDNPGEVGPAIQGSLKRKFDRVRTEKSRLYQAIGSAAGDDTVPTTSMQAAARALINDQSLAPALQNPQLAARLEKYSVPQDTTFDQLQLIRSQLGSRIRDLSSGKANVDIEGEVQALKSVKSALELDMSNFANSMPGTRDAWTKADKYYREKFLPLKASRALQNAMRTEEPDRLFEKWVKVSTGFGGYGDRAKTLYRALDGEGRAAVRYAIVAKALQKATREGDPTAFNPSTFARLVQQQGDAVDVFFGKQSAKELLGLAKLLKRTAWHGDANPATGARIQDLVSVGGAVGATVAPAATGAAVIGAGFARYLMTSNRGRTILAKAAEPRSSDQIGSLQRQAEYVIKSAAALERRAGAAAGIEASEAGLLNDQPYSPN